MIPSTLGWSTMISTLKSWGTHWIFCSQWTQKDHTEPNFWLEMGPSYWPRLMLLEQTGPSGRQLQRPFWAICHCEKGSEMCLELLTSLWGFQKWCEKVESDQKWPSYRTLKAFLGHLSLWKGVWNVSRINELALRFPKMVWKSQIGPKMTELQNFESYQLLQIRTAVAATGCEASLQGLIQLNTTRPLLWFL